nr:Rne/Rng family ribonuclease [uncultured Shimia sp.]
MPKKMLIDATHAEETRVVVVDGNKVEEFDFESENKRQLAGNIYLAKVTRVEPSLQAAFVDYGGNRHGFLAFSEIHPDYYQIPVADREALLEEERAYAESLKARDEDEEKPKSKPRRARSRSRGKAKEAPVVEEAAADQAPSTDTATDVTQIDGMETIDLGDDTTEGLSPMELVHETPVQEPEESPKSEASDTDKDVVEEVKAVDVVADEEPVAADVAEADAPVDAVEAQAEVDEAVVAVDADDADVATSQDTSDEAPKDGGDKYMAADTDGEDAVVSRDPKTGEDTETKASDAAVQDDEVTAEPVVAAPEIVAAEPVEAATPASDAKEDTADSEEDAGVQADAADADDDDAPAKGSDATAKDASIESVADEDDSEDIRPPRKPRPRRYKIQEVIKVRQILLVQVVKEERGNKGAALTTYLSLAGRYCVLMPNTARGGGISRKITNAVDRKKLKEIAAEIDVPQGAGLIVRTAGAKRTKAEIKRDYEYLQRLWEQIRELTLKSIAPSKIYEEGDLIKRSIRDLYNREIDEVFVEGERGYRIAKDFMKMIMPSHAKNVKKYEESLPLFARYQVESYLSSMFNPTVQLKSGGYIVIGVTEALVAIDVNSGRATKENSIEETALKTNLEAAEEVARQLRLRDLAGLIVIDFIDMDERKNNTAVEKRMKDKLKTDRARIQVGRISGFGLMEMSRQRLRPGMIEATTQPCPHCHGTGLIRSDDNLALSILRQIEEEGTRRRSREVLVKAPVAIANYLMNQKREHIAQIEGRYGLSVRVEGDPMLVSPDFSIEKLKTATRIVAEVAAPVVSVDTSLMDEIDEDVAQDQTAPVAAVSEEEQDDKPKKRRRRRRRRKSGGENSDVVATEDGASAESGTADASENAATDEAAPEQASEGEAEKKPRRSRSRNRNRSRAKKSEDTQDADVSATSDASEPTSDAKPVETEAPQAATEARDVSEDATPVVNGAETVDAAPQSVETATEVSDAPVEKTDAKPVVVDEPAPVEDVVAAPVEAEVVQPDPAPTPAPVASTAPAAPAKPKRKGWWSMGG